MNGQMMDGLLDASSNIRLAGMPMSVIKKLKKKQQEMSRRTAIPIGNSALHSHGYLNF